MHQGIESGQTDGTVRIQHVPCRPKDLTLSRLLWIVSKPIVFKEPVRLLKAKLFWNFFGIYRDEERICMKVERNFRRSSCKPVLSACFVKAHPCFSWSLGTSWWTFISEFIYFCPSSLRLWVACSKRSFFGIVKGIAQKAFLGANLQTLGFTSFAHN